MAKTKASTVNESKINKLKQWMMISVIAAAIVVSFSLVALKFLFDLWVYNNNVQAAQRETQATIETNIEIFDELEEAFISLESAQGTPASPDGEVVLDALPRNYDFPALASSMQKLANSSGVELISFSGIDEEGTVPEPSYNPTPYNIFFGVEIDGSYEDIQVFVNALDLSIRPFHVSELELQGSDDSLRAEVSMITYFQPTQNLDYPERTVQ